jgi:hypothetical protein
VPGFRSLDDCANKLAEFAQIAEFRPLNGGSCSIHASESKSLAADAADKSAPSAAITSSQRSASAAARSIKR